MVLRRTSFPTKLSTYVLAARPILAHAPRDSSIASLEEARDCVAWWPDQDPTNGADVILRAWATESFHASRHLQAEAIRARYYDLASNRHHLLGVLNALPGDGGQAPVPY